MANGWRKPSGNIWDDVATGHSHFYGAIGSGVAHRPSACPDLTHAVPAETIKALSHGFNLAGWMDGPQSTPPSPGVLRSLRIKGMTHVRLPVAAERLMRRFTSERDLNDQLRAVDHGAHRAAVDGLSRLCRSSSRRAFFQLAPRRSKRIHDVAAGSVDPPGAGHARPSTGAGLRRTASMNRILTPRGGRSRPSSLRNLSGNGFPDNAHRGSHQLAARGLIA